MSEDDLKVGDLVYVYGSKHGGDRPGHHLFDTYATIEAILEDGSIQTNGGIVSIKRVQKTGDCIRQKLALIKEFADDYIEEVNDDQITVFKARVGVNVCHSKYPKNLWDMINHDIVQRMKAEIDELRKEVCAPEVVTQKLFGDSDTFAREKE